MQRADLALLSNALTTTSQPSQPQLNDEDYVQLTLLTSQTAQRYPTQDLSESMEGYLLDFERLAAKHSLSTVKEALARLRLSPDQKFFPRPDEVAEEIHRLREERAQDALRAATERRIALYDSDFWAWVDCRLQDPDTAGMTEQEFLNTIKRPGYIGLQARTHSLTVSGAAA